ncbi:hypothetical protein QT621_23255 [Xanthomonas citri pv. citri]
MKIVVRADASLTMGSGHIMRCLTLADRLEQNSKGMTSRLFVVSMTGIWRI